MIISRKKSQGIPPAAFGRAMRGAIAAAIIGPVTVLALTGGAGLAAAAAKAPAPDGYRGRLVSVTPLRTLPDKAAVRAELTADGFAATSARYGVRTYRLVYRTVSPAGQPTTASGL